MGLLHKDSCVVYLQNKYVVYPAEISVWQNDASHTGLLIIRHGFLHAFYFDNGSVQADESDVEWLWFSVGIFGVHQFVCFRPTEAFSGLFHFFVAIGKLFHEVNQTVGDNEGQKTAAGNWSFRQRFLG